MQHLLQTTSYNFPMRGAGRTTVSDTEVTVDDADYSAAIVQALPASGMAAYAARFPFAAGRAVRPAGAARLR